MADKTGISWTDATWNPVTGCSKVSPGCANCYAETLSLRLQRMGNPKYTQGFAVTLHPDALGMPASWRKPRRIFVNSMSDLFHRDVPDWMLRRVWAEMLKHDRHTYQILTKRPHRMELKIRRLELPLAPHIWLGTSVESQRFADSRIPPLLSIGGPGVRFLSCEPLLGKVTLTDYLGPGGVNWVIAGGESGPGYRPCDPYWVQWLRDQCRVASIPFWFKQWSGSRPAKRPPEIDGRQWTEMPEEAIA